MALEIMTLGCMLPLDSLKLMRKKKMALKNIINNFGEYLLMNKKIIQMKIIFKMRKKNNKKNKILIWIFESLNFKIYESFNF